MSKRYHIELDYNGYLLEPRSYRISESPLFGSRFSTGRTSYASLDFWQTGGMTDFTHGMGQEFLSDPSAYQFSIGIDVSQPGKFCLEKDLKDAVAPPALTKVCSSYATLDKLYVGTEDGKIFSLSTSGTWTQESLPVTSGKIYSFYELKGKLFALKGPNKQLKKDGTWSETNVQQAYFCSVLDDVGYMVFNGYEIRTTEDGINFAPPLNQPPLFQISQSDGKILNIASLPTRRLLGTQKSLYVHIGGSSGVKLHDFPALSSTTNFTGMTSWVSLAIFSIDKFGIFYSEGSGIYPTNLNYLNQFFKFKACHGITTLLNDVYAIVEDSLSNYYLARACLNYMGAPSYFWLVCSLSGAPCHIASFNNSVYIFHTAGTVDEIDKTKYQSSGYLITPRIDCDLVLIQKYFRSVSAMMEPLPESTSVDIRFVLDESMANSNFANWTSQTFSTTGTTRAGYTLPNPSLGQEIKVGVKLETTNKSKTPVITDVLWTYFLEQPEGQTITKTFYGTVIAEDHLEKLDGEVYDPGYVEGKTRQQIIDSLWESAMKKQLLNFVGPDNEEFPAITIKHSSGTCKVKVDATNNYLIFSLGQYIDYSGMTLENLVTAINKITGYEATLHPQANKDTPAESLMPIINKECKNGLLLYTGTDIHTVLFAEGGIGQLKLAFADPGSDRIQIALREAL